MKHDYNSSANQSVKSKLVGREVYYCQTMVVEELFKDNQEEFYELDNVQYYTAELSNDSFEGSYDEKSDLIEELEEKRDRLENANYKIEEYRDNIEDNDDLYDLFDEKYNEIQDIIIELESDIDILENSDTEYAEIYEWWLISNYLAGKLSAYGQVVYEDYGSTWWGRQGTGQAILLDHVISKIAEDMEILEGQENHKFWV
jgi:hypothetical protein